MYKVLLVDDERIILDGMSNFIPWEEVGSTLIGTAKNGIEAFGIIETNQPHIVITDIKMPGMNGLELVEKTYETYPDIRFIMLSGFGEFDYAKQAMKYGVKHYLVKPCNEQMILDAMEEIIADLEQKEHQEQVVLEVKERLDELEKNRTTQFDDPNKHTYSPIVQQVMQAVEEEIGNPDLSLNFIAQEELYMSADYVGKLFKRETGERFSNYVSRVRIEKAMDIIREENDVKIFELADKLGFSDSQYFSQVFKRLTGFTPSEYRKESFPSIS